MAFKITSYRRVRRGDKLPPSAPALLSGAPAGPQPTAEPATPRGKIGVVVDLLKRPQGASMLELTMATGWQAHSVRGALSSSVKKGLGLTVVSSADETGRRYRIGAVAEPV
jgi:hypothetical protein